MEYIRIHQTQVENNKIFVRFEVSSHLEKFFLTHEFTCEFSHSIESSPKGIAIIPFVCNVLPIIWLTDSELIVPELDEDFFNSIDEFKKGYIEMYPMLKFKGKISVGKVKKNRPFLSGGSACFFSGGVDAFNTLYNHIDEKPKLITIWGADVKLTDTDGWQIVHQHALDTASNLGLESYVIKTNFRNLLNEVALYRKLIRSSEDGWWHGFQHGIGLIGLAAPMAYSLGFDKLYIASSYTAADKGTITCASDPTIDNYVRFAGCHVIHDGYEFDRLEKVRNICQRVEARNDYRPVLRVCWVETGGKNCCRCEKCLRTMMELIALGRNPAYYGFEYSKNDLKHSRQTVLLAYNRVTRPLWCGIQNQVTQSEMKLPEDLSWINDIDFERDSKSISIKLLKLRHRLTCRIKSMFKK